MFSLVFLSPRLLQQIDKKFHDNFHIAIEWLATRNKQIKMKKQFHVSIDRLCNNNQV